MNLHMLGTGSKEGNIQRSSRISLNLSAKSLLKSSKTQKAQRHENLTQIPIYLLLETGTVRYSTGISKIITNFEANPKDPQRNSRI